MSIYLLGFLVWVCLFVWGFFVVPRPAHLFAKKGSVLQCCDRPGSGLDIGSQHPSGAVISLAVPFEPAACKCDYTGNKFLKCFPPSLSNKIE